MNWEILMKVLELNKFRYKEIEAWEKLYSKFNCYCCDKNKVDTLTNLRKSGAKYVACVEYNNQHICQVVPIIIGSKLDIQIQRKLCKNITDYETYLNLKRNFEGTLLNFGFFSYFPKYLMNNNKQVHLFKSYNSSTTTRLFLYNEKNYGHMLYLQNDKLIIRMPSKEEFEIHPEFMQHKNFLKRQDNSIFYKLLELAVGGPLINFNLDSFIELFKLSNEFLDIDDINNKSVYNAPILLEQLILTLFETDGSRAKSIKQAITSGHLFFIQCKKENNNNTNKEKKDIARHVSKTGSHSIYNEKEMYCNVDECTIERSLNQIKRCNSINSKFISYNMPSNSTGIISLFYCANMNKVNKNLVLTHHTNITFIDHSQKYFIYKYLMVKACNEDCTDAFYEIFFNSIPCGAKVCKKHIVLFFLTFKILLPDLNMILRNKFILVQYQSGYLKYPIQIAPSSETKICQCRNLILEHNSIYIFKQLYELSLIIKKQLNEEFNFKSTWCGNHIFINNEELKFLEIQLDETYEFKYFQIMCHDTLKIARYVNLMPLSKMITAVKNARGSYSTDIFLETNKELTRGYAKNAFIELFTLFYDFQGLNVEDGYLLDKNVNLDIQLFVKNSVIFSFKTKNHYFIEKILEIIAGNYNEIHICKVYSETPLTFKFKRMKVHLISEVGVYIYLIILPLISNIISIIDPNSLNLTFQQIKKNITISLLYNTKPDCKYNIKLSNSFGQKGMVTIADLSSLTTKSGQKVEITANPLAILKRSSFGQIKDMHGSEKVYHNGQYVGVGAFCKYFVVNTFPHENIHGGVLGSPMKLDKLTYNAAIGNNNPLVALQNETQYSLWPNQNLERVFSLFKLFGKEVVVKDYHNWAF